MLSVACDGFWSSHIVTGLDPRTYLYEYSLRRDGVLQGEQEWVVITEDLGADPRQVTLSDLQVGGG